MSTVLLIALGLLGVLSVVVLGLMAAVLSSLVKSLIEGEIRGALEDHLRERVHVAASLLPSEIRDDQEAEWLYELAAARDRPRLALRFVRGLPSAARAIGAQIAPPQAGVAASDAFDRVSTMSLSDLELARATWRTFLRSFYGRECLPVDAQLRIAQRLRELHAELLDGTSDRTADARSSLRLFLVNARRPAPN